MPVRTADYRRSRSISRSRAALLAGVSALALMTASAQSEAGDILRGNKMAAPVANVTAQQAAAMQEAQRAAVRTQNSLARATQAMQAMRAAQNAARDLALKGPGTVPNGLGEGGLVVAPGATPGATNGGDGLWQGADLPTQQQKDGRTEVTVTQNEKKAILTWESFNVGRETDLQFDQSAGGAGAKEWIALNRVEDPSAAPSKILGSIKAEGQVYIINRNGIVFGGSSQVNTSSLVASSLKLSNEQFMAGINNPLYFEATGGNHFGIPQFGEFTDSAPNPYDGLEEPGQAPRFEPGAVPGSVNVAAGAQLETAEGGKIMLFAPEVENGGHLSAPDGQVILAAGENVWLTKSREVRGLDVAVSAPAAWAFNYYIMTGALGLDNVVGAQKDFADGIRDVVMPEMEARAASAGYHVTNTGIVEAARGDITLQSREIVQDGSLLASTALNNRDGSIRLQAWGQGMLSYSSATLERPTMFNWSAGILTLAPGSVTQVVPDLGDTSEIEAAAIETRYTPGRVEMDGSLIDIQSGASVIVPSGFIELEASDIPLHLQQSQQWDDERLRDGSRIYIGSDAFLSVGGLRDVFVPMERNIVEAEFRINELRDSPLYKNSWLRGAKVLVDRRDGGTFSGGPMEGVEWIEGSPGEWAGSPLGDLTAWIGVGKTDLQELSTAGGEISVKSGGSFVTREGSLLDVSGGSVRYGDGWVSTTQLLGADGRIYDIGEATPDMIYVGIAGQFTRHHQRWGVSETWSSPLRSGRRFEKGYTEGRDAGAVTIFAGEAIVLEGGFAGDVIASDRQAQKQAALADAGRLQIGGPGVTNRPWSLGELIITDNPVLLPEDFTSLTPVGEAYYDPDNPDIELPYHGKITYLSAETLNEAGMGAFAFYVTNDFMLEEGVDLVFDPGTSFLAAGNVGDTVGTANFRVDGTITAHGGSIELSALGDLEFGEGAVLDASGEWINSFMDGSLARRWAADGGTITLFGRDNYNVAEGVLLDVSGGGRVTSSGGEPELRRGDAGSVILKQITADSLPSFELRAFAPGSGGNLELTTLDPVQVGGAAEEPDMLVLPERLFSDKGFSALRVTTIDFDENIIMPEGAAVSQLPVSVDLAGANYASFASGTRIAETGHLAVLRPEERTDRAPTLLALHASGGHMYFGKDSLIRTDIGGRVELAVGNTGVASGLDDIVLGGTIDVPAGSIQVDATGAISLPDGASLTTRGEAVIYDLGFGQRAGRVLPGGSISLEGHTISIERGSLIDVSGARGEIDVPQLGAFMQRHYAPTQLASDGGSVFVKGMGLVEGTLRGEAGGAGASGGSLSFEFDAPSGSGGVADTIKEKLTALDPDCIGIAGGNGVCTGDDWREALGIDYTAYYGPYLGWYGIEFDGVIMIPEAVAAVLAGGDSGIVLSETASGTGETDAFNPADYGFTTELLDLFATSLFDMDFGSLFAAPPQPNLFTVRPSSIQGSGFADLGLSSGNDDVSILLDNTDLSLSRSISIYGGIVNMNGGNAVLRAPHISLSGRSAGAFEGGHAGRLNLSASLIDIDEIASIGGFSETILSASDIRFTGELPRQTKAMLDTEGVLVLNAGQVYPGSRIDATIRATEKIIVWQNGKAGPALSAAGQLTLAAPEIEQGGTLRAPFGSITLDAENKITLGEGSVTSVSGDGLVLPYGNLSNNEHWVLPTGQDQPEIINALPEKRITLDAQEVELGAGSVVDITGGGDLHAWEFVPGPGGSHDILAMPGMYAIMPEMAGVATGAGERVWLAGGNGLAAGWYTLLPAHYALLPGAYAVQMAGGAQGGTGIATGILSDGSTVMAGYRGNAFDGSGDVLPSSWRVMSGANVRQYTEYNEALANDYFASEAFKLTQYRLTGEDVVTPRLPQDGGALVLKAAQDLILDGQLRSQPGEGGRGGLVDIAVEKIAILGAGQDETALRADGYLVIDSGSLSGFGAGSLLVGGIRSGDAQGLRVDVTAQDIVVRNDAGSALTGPEIILAASEGIDVGAGSVIAAEGEAGRGSGDLIMSPQEDLVYVDPDGWDDGNPDDDIIGTPSRDWGAVVRVSNGEAVRVVRENVDTSIGGLVTVGENAELSGGGALLIDATQNTALAASAQLSGTVLSVASGRIGFGGGSEGLILDTASLAQFANTDHLTLRSYTTIDFHDSVDLSRAGLGSVAFDAAGLVGYGSGETAVAGERIILQNSGGNFTEPAGAGNGSLALTAGELVLGGGEKTIRGFGNMRLAGQTRVLASGDGSLDAGSAALVIDTPLLTGADGVAHDVVTSGKLAVTGGGAAASAEGLEDSLGVRLALTGGEVVFAGQAAAWGGTINLAATSGNLTVADGARLDVRGFGKTFFDIAEYADAGSIGLSAAGGDVYVASGAALDLGAAAGGGSGGALSVTAAGGGSVTLDGAIFAQAGAGGEGGSFALDIAALPDFAGFSERLNTAGFTSRDFRIRNGDVVIDGTTQVTEFTLTADQGQVRLTGTVDARTLYGGDIRITGGDGVVMMSSARLYAGATETEDGLGSGRVVLDAAGGRLDVRGGIIDVAGAYAGSAAGVNNDGTVRFRARQTAGHDGIAADRAEASIIGARAAVLEGVAVYDLADYDGATVDSVMGDAIAGAETFMGHAGGIAGAVPGASGLTLASGIEIRSADDMALNSDWNLSTLTAREGTLTLRAGGDLTVLGHISDGFSSADRSGTLLGTRSWNLELVAGGDLSSANALALRSMTELGADKGMLTVGDADNGKVIRTGTGSLDVRAGRDIGLAHAESVIYTAGRRDATSWADFSTAPADAAYGIEGGHLDVRAQGSVNSLPSGQGFVQWLNRQGNVNDQLVFDDYEADYTTHPAEQSSWWINYGAFQQGVGALGGGNVNVSAGGDLDNLLVALPTNARLRGGRTAGESMTLEMRNGGAMQVNAGGTVRGGQYYIARGEGSISAGETAAGHNVIYSGSGSTTTYSVAPILALGDAVLKLRTAGDLELQTVVDPLMVRYGDDAEYSLSDYGAYMSGYTDRTALDLVSVGGDVTLVSQGDYIFRDTDYYRNNDRNLSGIGANRYPAIFRTAALNGSVEIQGPVTLMPGYSTDLRILAGEDVRFNGQNRKMAQILMPRGTPEMMPSPFLPVGAGGFPHQIYIDTVLSNPNQVSVNFSPSNTSHGYYMELSNPERLPLADDYEPSRIYAGGSVIETDLVTNEQTWIKAGQDIRGLLIEARHNRASDITLLEAGNDIIATTPNRRNRNLGNGRIDVQGPGGVVLAAGRDVYTAHFTVITTGNEVFDFNNRPVEDLKINGLPDEGASITVMAGLGDDPAYDAFSQAYLDPENIGAMPDYLKAVMPDGSVLPIYLTDLTEMRGEEEKLARRGLVSFMQEVTGEELAPLDAWARFQALPSGAQERFFRRVYMQELRDAGRNQNQLADDGGPLNGGYNRGYEAAETLFPGEGWKGDVIFGNGLLRTMSGGDVEVLTPGGGLQVASLGAEVPSGYGLVTLDGGYINIFAKDNVTVNRSRVLTFVPEGAQGSSDMIIWSTLGDIDAGRGAKTVRVPSAPDVETDEDANTEILERSDISGSGIGTVGNGDLDLIAPEGTVNAGDAGIRVAGNLNVAALQVVNADNFDVEGEIQGVPQETAPVSLTTDAGNEAQNAASDAAEAATRNAARRNEMPSIITVEVLGYGPEGGASADPQPDGRRGRAAGQESRYDPSSLFQVIGDGELTEAQKSLLTEEERQRL